VQLANALQLASCEGEPCTSTRTPPRISFPPDTLAPLGRGRAAACRDAPWNETLAQLGRNRIEL
jgi:hypothetical protein